MIFFALYVERLTMQWNIGLSIHPDIVRHSPGINFYEIHPKKRVSFDNSIDPRSLLDGMKEPAMYERRMLRLFHHMMQFSLACTLKKSPTIPWYICWNVWKSGTFYK